MVKNKGLKIFFEKNKASRNFGLFLGKHSGRVFPIKNDCPLIQIISSATTIYYSKSDTFITFIYYRLDKKFLVRQRIYLPMIAFLVLTVFGTSRYYHVIRYCIFCDFFPRQSLIRYIVVLKAVIHTHSSDE